MAQFEIYTGGNDEFYFRLVAADGNKLLRSEGYKAKPSCTNGIESVRKNSQDDKRFELETAKNGQFFFNLTSTNGQTIATSEMYKTEGERQAEIDAVKKEAPTATVDDQTA